MNIVQWSKIDPTCSAGLHRPKRTGDVGWDLEAAEDVVIRPGEAVDVPTNIRLHLPGDIWAEIRARSSIARRGLQVDAGLIDNGYRGAFYVLIRNMKTLQPDNMLVIADSSNPYGLAMEWKEANSVQIKAGERVAQVVFYQPCRIRDKEVEQIDKDSERGSDGFGSTNDL